MGDEVDKNIVTFTSLSDQTPKKTKLATHKHFVNSENS